MTDKKPTKEFKEKADPKEQPVKIPPENGDKENNTPYFVRGYN